MGKLLISAFLILLSNLSFGQSIDSLMLTDNDIPTGYVKSNDLLCKTVHSLSFYEQSDLYAGFLGAIKKKSFQSFEKKGDKGSILYFEFEKEFEGNTFLDGLLWGQPGKPTKAKPDEYFSKANILIIWSLDKSSEIKKISQAKIASILK